MVSCQLVNLFPVGRDAMAHQMREEPGPGTYRCVNCDDWEVTLDEGDQLPPCGNCGEGKDPRYEKVD